jgi:hypothetical protein
LSRVDHLAVKKAMTKKEKRAMMESVVRDCQASGITQVEYAKVRDMNISRLRYWIHKSAGDDRQQPAFLQIGYGPMLRNTAFAEFSRGCSATLPARLPLSSKPSLPLILLVGAGRIEPPTP